MREGSRVNRIAIDHVHEWIKVQQRLNQKIESERETETAEDNEPCISKRQRQS